MSPEAADIPEKDGHCEVVNRGDMNGYRSGLGYRRRSWFGKQGFRGRRGFKHDGLMGVVTEWELS